MNCTEPCVGSLPVKKSHPLKKFCPACASTKLQLDVELGVAPPLVLVGVAIELADPDTDDFGVLDGREGEEVEAMVVPLLPPLPDGFGLLTQ